MDSINVESAIHELRKLIQMLERPEPGLMTWTMMFHAQLKRVRKELYDDPALPPASDGKGA